MRNPILIQHRLSVLACALIVAASAAATASDKIKPSVSLRASPQTGFAPTRVVLTAEIKGGADDYADYYCPTIEWVWGDDTKAESKIDCEPYEAGKSEIKRRYVFDRVFQTPGNFRVEFRLKQKDKVVGSTSTSVNIRPGIRDGIN
jgi:hypothetical protein